MAKADRDRSLFLLFHVGMPGHCELKRSRRVFLHASNHPIAEELTEGAVLCDCVTCHEVAPVSR